VRKTLSILVACLVTAGLFGIACKKTDPKDLAYQDIYKNKYLEAHVKNKDGIKVLWIQILDRIDHKSVPDSYKNEKNKIDKYPAKIHKDQSVSLLVNNRMEVRVIAYGKAKDFHDTDELIKFIKLFDLAGMEELTGPKQKAEELEKFIPKLGGK
jgi:hypothetical protein